MPLNQGVVMANGYWVWVAVVCCGILFGSFSKASSVISRKIRSNVVAGNFETPTRLAKADEIPQFVDDLNFEWLELAVQRQLKRYADLSLKGSIRYGGDTYPLTRVRESLEHILSLSKTYRACLETTSPEICGENLQTQVVEDFKIYVPNLGPKDPRYGDKEDTFFTGYYTPLIQATDRPTADSPHAIYGRPAKSPLTRATREEIDFDHVLKGSGAELFYAQDLFELYIMQVEGGGRVEVDVNGIKRFYYLTFDGTNRRSFRFISKYMMEKGYISERSNAAQHKFLKENPHKEREIYSTCPSYVFFKVSDTPPLGNDLVPLTDNRSIATDSSLYTFKGGLAFVSSRRPQGNQSEEDAAAGKLKYKPYSRFVLDQDTGGAIKGKARVDMYWGEGEYASLAAHNSSHTGKIFFLIKN